MRAMMLLALVAALALAAPLGASASCEAEVDALGTGETLTDAVRFEIECDDPYAPDTLNSSMMNGEWYVDFRVGGRKVSYVPTFEGMGDDDPEFPLTFFISVPGAARNGLGTNPDATVYYIGSSVTSVPGTGLPNLATFDDTVKTPSKIKPAVKGSFRNGVDVYMWFSEVGILETGTLLADISSNVTYGDARVGNASMISSFPDPTINDDAILHLQLDGVPELLEASSDNVAVMNGISADGLILRRVPETTVVLGSMEDGPLSAAEAVRFWTLGTDGTITKALVLFSTPLNETSVSSLPAANFVLTVGAVDYTPSNVSSSTQEAAAGVVEIEFVPAINESKPAETLFINPDGILFDVAGFEVSGPGLLLGANGVSHDSAPPGLVGVTTTAGESVISIEFTEPMVIHGGAIDVTLLQTNDGTPIEVTNVTTSGNNVLVHLGSVLETYRSGDYNISMPFSVNLHDKSGNGFQTVIDKRVVANSDTTPPSATSVVTGDTNGDGSIDQIVVTFSEALNGTTEAGEWTVDGFVVNRTELNSPETVTLVLNVDAASPPINTEAVPAVTYSGTGLTDLAFIAANQTMPGTTDGAGPVLLKVEGAHGDTAVTATFSEPIGASPFAGTFMFGGAAATAGDADVAGASVTVTLGAALNTADFLNGGTVLSATSVADAASGAPGTSSANLVPTAAAAAAASQSAVETADTASAGVVDQIRVTFDRGVAVLGDVAGFAVVNYTVSSVALDGGDNTVVLLGVSADNADTAGGTGSVPEVSFAGSANLTNLVGVEANGFAAETAADGAPPVPLAVSGYPGQSNFTVTFSEPVTLLDETAVEWLGGPYRVEESDPVGGAAKSSSWVLSIDPLPDREDFKSERFGTPGVSVSVFPEFGRDGSDNDVVETTDLHLTFLDTEAPTVLGAKAQDESGDGLVDRVRVAFSEDVYFAPGFSAKDGWTVTHNGTEYPVDDARIFGTSGVDLIVGTRSGVPGDTDVTPLVTYNASAGGLFDLSLNPLASVAVNATDDAPPVIVSAESVVGSDKVLVTVSEPFDAGTVGDAASAAALTGPLADFAITAANPSGRVLELTLNGPLELGDFNGSTVALAARITDLAGLAAVTAPKPLTNSDQVAPAFVQAFTLDSDANGVVDAVVVVFNESMAVNGATSDQFAVAGRGEAATPVRLGDSENSLVFDIAEGDVLDTGVTTLLLGYARGSVTDINGKHLEDFSDESIGDGAGPALVGASAQLESHTMDVEFSEPVLTADTGDFEWSGAAGLPAVNATLVAGGNSSTVVLTFDGPLPAAAFGESAKIQVAARNTIVDAARNAAPSQSVSVTQINPVVVSAVTADLAGEGKVSAIRVVFDRDMGDAEMLTAGFSVVAGGLTVSGASFTRITGTTFELDVTGGDGRGTALGDTVNVSLSYNASAGSVASASGADLLSFDSLPVGDGAGPVLLSVTMNVNDSRVRATFSEPVFDAKSDPDSAVDPAAAFAYEVAQPAPVLLSTFDGVQDGTADGVMVVNTDGTFVFADLGRVLLVVDGEVRDRAGNNAVAGTPGKALAFEDTEAPSLVSAEAHDSSGDGAVDQVVLQFSEPIRNQSVQAADFALGGADAGAAVIDGAAVAGSTVTLSVRGLGANTGVNLTVSVVSSVSDLNRNELEGTEPEACEDRARPVVLRVTGTVDEDLVTVYLSEPVASAFEAADFSVDPGAAATPAFAVAAVEDGDASQDGTVVLRLNRTLSLADLDQAEPSNLIVLAGGVAVDANRNGNVDGEGRALQNAVDTASALVSAETMDVDGDGRLDHVRLVFGARLVDSSFIPAQHVSVGGFVVNGLADASAGLSDTVDDTEVVVAISLPAGSALSVNQGNTALTPLVTLTPGASAPSDVHGLTFAAGSVTAADKAEPVVVSAYGGLGSDQVVVHLSEEVPSSLLSSSFQYVDSNAGEAGGVSRILRAEPIDGLRVPITVAGTFVASDLGAAGDQIGLAADVVTDSNGNVVSVARTRPIMSSDALESSASSSADTVALAVGGSAAFLGIMLLVVLFVIKKKKTTGDKGALEMHVNENITTEGSMEQYAAPNTGGDEEVGAGMPASSSTDNLVTREPEDAEEVVVEVSAVQRPSTPPGDPPSDGEE